MRSKRKRMVALTLSMTMLLISNIQGSAKIVYRHGNDGNARQAYAITEADSPANIGAMITYQVSGTTNIINQPKQYGFLLRAESRTPALRGKSGWSYGYYYYNNPETPSHESTKRMTFNF